MWIWLSAAALAGYGDPDAGPTLIIERSVHFWTNAARVAPEAWTADYDASREPCNLSGFSSDERTPKAPLSWSVSLGQVAREHSADQAANGVMQHESSDGTAWDVRVGGAYGNPTIGENVSRDYLNGRHGVLEGWMCSGSGHRATIMREGYTELGVGVVDGYFTQDFGGAEVPGRRLNAGVIEGFDGEIHAMVDWSGDGDPPNELVAWVNGSSQPLSLLAGAPEAGIYGVPVLADEETGCVSVWFEAAGERYPEQGSFGAGSCDYDDPAAGWIDAQRAGGCSHAPGVGGLWLVGLLATRRRWS